MTDRRDLDQIFGSVFRNENGQVSVGVGRTEACLRRNLASAAHAFGWLVEEEVVVPGWGRIDIVVRDGRNAPVLIELKLDLTKPARIRRAFQQTDGYGRWWVQERNEAADTLLVGLKVDSTAMNAVFRAYPHVGWRTAGGLLGEFEARGDEDSRMRRRQRAVLRRADLRRLALAYDTAVAALPPDPVSDVLGPLDMFELFATASGLTTSQTPGSTGAAQSPSADPGATSDGAA